jgi:predicted O-methyltransferase YrrM
MKSQINFVEVPSTGHGAGTKIPRGMQHPIFAWMGMRAPLAQHTRAEHEALMKYAKNARTIVEIGVAEGASAVGLHEAMPQEGTLYLVDPFHLSRLPVLNFEKRAARRAVNASGKAQTVWIEEFSQEAVKKWKDPIDLLLIDGDHREEAVERDWREWAPFARDDGVVAFHDARLFPGGWPSPDYGPVRFIDRIFRRSGALPWKIIEEVDSLVFVSRLSGIA